MADYPSGINPADFPEPFAQLYRQHVQHLQLKGLRPKTIDAYARAMRRIGAHFDYQVCALSPDQLSDYFTRMLAQHSWSGVKLDLYGLKFFTQHVLGQPWRMPGFIRPPKTSRLPDIVSVEQAQAIFDHTRCLSYRVLFFTLYSLGLRLGEGLALTVADIDAQRLRVHVRNAKGNRDRLVPLPEATLTVLRAFWAEHRHPKLLFPNRAAGREGACRATSPLDRGGVQRALARVVQELGLKKRSPPTACAIAMPRT
jgi:integrase/recombinase XerD